MAEPRCKHGYLLSTEPFQCPACAELKALNSEIDMLKRLISESCDDMRSEGHYEGLGQCPQIEILTGACKAALAVLSQNATFPADIVAAKAFLSGGLSRAFAE